MRMARLILPAALLLAITSPLLAQGEPRQPPSLAEAMRGGFTQATNRLLQAAEGIPETQYDFKPAPTVRSIRQLIAHIADGSNYYCARAAGRNIEWTDAVETANLPKAQLLARVRASNDVCNAVPASAAGQHHYLVNLIHVENHYGNLVTTMRVAGLTPPQNN